MKASPRLLLAMACAALLPACGENDRDDTNPFVSAARTVPPPVQAALVFTSSLYTLLPGAGRDIYAVNADGGGLTRLTFCNDGGFCDYAEAAPAPDRDRVGVRKVSVDSNGDGLVSESDGAGLFFLDLRRGVEAPLVPASRRVSGADWAPSSGDFFIYSALPGGSGNEDLFIVNFNGTEDTALTCALGSSAPCDPTIRERRPRLDRLESQAVIERVDAAGNSVIVLFANAVSQASLTTGPHDADPAFSPDNRRVAFRRLVDPAANDGQGSWDIYSIGVTRPACRSWPAAAGCSAARRTGGKTVSCGPRPTRAANAWWSRPPTARRRERS
jgi:hypothetical protein